MRHLFIAAAVAAAFAAPAASAEAPAKGCHAHGAVDFKVGAKTWRAEAISEGPDCLKAVILLTLRTDEGFAVFSDVLAPDGIHFVEVDAADPKTMEKGLAALIAQEGALQTTADLKPWKKGEEAPEPSGEFPFYPDQDMNQEWYEELRAKKLPMFCYVPGLESLKCVALDPETSNAVAIGMQAFPG